MSSTTAVATAHSRVAHAVRRHGSTSSEAVEARRNLAAALIEKRVKEIVDAAPPLTAAQRSRLADLIGAGPAEI